MTKMTAIPTTTRGTGMDGMMMIIKKDNWDDWENLND